MVTIKINHRLLMLVLTMMTSLFLCFGVNWGEKLNGLEKKLDHRDLAEYNWTFARFAR
jgi:hypothetical protein